LSSVGEKGTERWRRFLDLVFQKGKIIDKFLQMRWGIVDPRCRYVQVATRSGWWQGLIKEG